MEEFLFFIEVLIAGLLSGIMYSLVALGLVLIFKASEIFNFAQGAMVLFGALTFVLLTELGGDFWDWTASLAILFALLAVLVLVLSKMTPLLNTERRFSRFIWAAFALLVLVLALFFDGGQNMWRAVFVTQMIFLMLTVGVRAPLWAAAILAGLAIASLFLDGAVFWRALTITLVIMICLAIAIERAVLRPMVNQEPIIMFMAAIGLNFIIEGIAQGVWDAEVHALDLGVEDFPIPALQELGLFISELDIFVTAVAAAMVAILAVFFNKTRIGRGLRAAADDHQAALSVGIPLQSIWVVVWSVSGIIAVFAGLAWGSKLGVQFSIALLAFKALPVIIIGGFTSILGAIIGGLIVGTTEKLFEFYIGIPYLGGGTESWSPYMLGVLFLMFKPQGLFGEKIIERV